MIQNILGVVGFVVYLAVMHALFKYITRKDRARRWVKKRKPTFYILTDEMSEPLTRVAEWLESEFGVKPIVSKKLPRDAGDDIVTIEEVGTKEDRLLIIEHVDFRIQARVECQCPETLPACQCAVLKMLAA